MTEDQKLLADGLEERFGVRFTYYAPTDSYYLDGVRFDLDKLEADYKQWIADGKPTSRQ